MKHLQVESGSESTSTTRNFRVQSTGPLELQGLTTMVGIYQKAFRWFAAVLLVAWMSDTMAEAGLEAKGPGDHTWVDADVSRAVVADLIHVQPDPIYGRHIV